MGGVTFDVPVEMHYNDPSQNLYIDLSAGEQKLDGAQAMQVMRFRSGYADADLGRVKVQRDFLAAALHQWASVKNAYKLPVRDQADHGAHEDRPDERTARVAGGERSALRHGWPHDGDDAGQRGLDRRRLVLRAGCGTGGGPGE